MIMTLLGFILSALFIGSGLAPVVITIIVKDEPRVAAVIAASSLLLSGSILLAATLSKVN